MKPQIRTDQTNVGIEVYIKNPDLSNLESTYLTADAAVGASSFTVQRGTGFTASTYIVIDYGTEIAEIHLISGTPTATSIALTSTTAYAHTKDAEIRFIPFNQFDLEDSSDNDTFASVASGQAIQPDKPETIYLDTTGTATQYYRFRFKNSTDTTYSPYSDSVLGSGYPDNSVFEIKRRSLESVNQKIGGVITDGFLNRALWQARRIVHKALKRWQFRQEFDKDIGTVTTGQYSLTTPTDLEDRNTSKNILGIRLQGYDNMDEISKAEWDREMLSVKHTTVATQALAGDTSIVLTDTGDLNESGTIKIAGDSVTYTANNESTNTLTGIPASGNGSITATRAVGVDVWQNVSFGKPDKFTVFENTIYFNVPWDSTYANKSIYSDYYKTVTAYDSDADTLDEPEYDFYVNYLAYRIKKQLNQGVIALEDDDFLAWQTGVKQMIKNEVSDQKIQFIPDISHLMDESIEGV